MYLVDTSAVLAVILEEAAGPWFESFFDRLRSEGDRLAINQVVFAECCAIAGSYEQARETLRPFYDFEALPWEACFPAGRAYRAYKSRGGKRPRMLPDFLVAAHAACQGAHLVTNNPSDVRSYFPLLEVVSPES